MSNQHNDATREFSVIPELQDFLDIALARFAYLHPEVKITGAHELRLEAAEGIDLDAAVVELRYELYRQKIFHDTLLLRQALTSEVLKP